VVKRAPTKKASLVAINAAAAATPVAGGGHTREVFDEMPERCVSIFFSVDTPMAGIDERRARAEEKRATAELIIEENKIIMMNSSKMDEFTKEWWNLSRMEILQRRRDAALLVARCASTAVTTGGGDGAGGGGVGGDA
jgi:hypothetical protein